MARLKNAEGYMDPTAYYAERSIEKEERRLKRMGIKRGDIFYVNKSVATVGSEQYPGRPAIIVSNDKNNEHSETVEVVYMTTAPKKDLPTHVTIRSTGRESIAVCEQITSVAVERLGSYNGHVTTNEMTNIEIAMAVSLDMTIGTPKEKVVEVTDERLVKEVAELREKLLQEQTKYDMLRRMYEDLLCLAIGKN